MVNLSREGEADEARLGWSSRPLRGATSYSGERSNDRPMSESTTFAPSAAKERAIASPIPPIRPAPVTIAT
jgi:hypothetical protein